MKLKLTRHESNPRLFWIEWPDKTRSSYPYNKTRANYYIKYPDLLKLPHGEEKYYPISNVE